MSIEKKIKICALATISKAMDWFMIDSMRNLSENGYDVTLISTMDEDFIARNSDFAKCIPLEMTRGASIRDLFRCTKRLRKIFKEEKFDVIYYMSPNASMYASLAAKSAGIKTRVYSQCGLRYISIKGIKRVIFKAVEWLTCACSTHIKAQSPKNMELAISEHLCPRKKISVVGIGGTVGVDIDACASFDHDQARKELREKYDIGRDDFVFGYVGRINADKGIGELVEAFGNVSKTIEGAKLVLVGMRDHSNPVSAETIAIIEGNDNIISTGSVPPDEVYAHMCMFDVLTHPTYREGFGKVLQEALGVGIPIITTNVPGPSEVIENNVSGILCRAADSEDLADKMMFMYENPDVRARFVHNGLKRARTYFDRPIMLENILQDMNKIMTKQN